MVNKSTQQSTGVQYVTERLRHFAENARRIADLQYVFASELQAQAALVKPRAARTLEELEKATAEAAAAAKPARSTTRPDGTPRKITTTQVWRSENDTSAPLGMPAKMPETWEWNDADWENFAELCRDIISGDIQSQIFQLVYEQAKRLLDALTNGGQQMPEQPIDQAILCGLAEQLEFLTGNIGLANEAAKRLAKLQKDDPLYDTKVNRLCSELFLEGAARLPDAVTPEAIQEHLELVTTLTRSRFQALAQKDGRLAADKPTRISHEKAYKQYFLQDFKSRLEALSEPAEPGEDAGEGMPRPIFSNDEEAVIMHLQRFADEVIDTAIAQARLDCKAIIKDFAAIDARIDAASDNWTLMRLDRADRCLLRLGTYEMLYASPKVTPAIAINEAIELAKRFCKQDSPAFVNGVLERIRVTAAAEPITFGA